jgi:hypothetical protein
VSGQSSLRETMADAWGSKVAGRWETDHPPVSQEEKVALFGGLATQVCQTNHPVIDPSALTSVSSTARAGANDPHSPGWMTLDRVVLTEPRVQAALGCEPDPKYNCLKSLGTSGKFQSKPIEPSDLENARTVR